MTKSMPITPIISPVCPRMDRDSVMQGFFVIAEIYTALHRAHLLIPPF